MRRHARRTAVLLLAGFTACASQRGTTRAAAPAEGAPGAGPLDVARAFYGALHRGDPAAAARLVASPNASAATGALVTLARSYQALEAVIGERFGARAAQAVGYSDRVASEDAALVGATADVQGDRAVVRSGGETLAILARGGGAWRIELEEALATERGLAALVLEAESSREAVARVSPAVRGGLFEAPEDALEAFKNDVALRMQGARPDLPRAPGEAPAGPGGIPL
ncbi:MAG: hypothetical protein ACJ79R_19595 [Anaeromyxobacteraceae bacterium]